MATDCSLYITITIIHNGYCHLAHPHPQKKSTRQLQTALYTDQDKYWAVIMQKAVILNICRAVESFWQNNE